MKRTVIPIKILLAHDGWLAVETDPFQTHVLLTTHTTNQGTAQAALSLSELEALVMSLRSEMYSLQQRKIARNRSKNGIALRRHPVSTREPRT